MKLLIGIYQNKEKMSRHFDSLHIKRREILEVGPFSSWQAAMQWMESMEKKLLPHNTQRYSLGHLVPRIWYGGLFEAE